MKKKCEAVEDCNSKVRYTVTDYELKKTANLCVDHFKNGMRAWIEQDPIIRHLMKEGSI